MEAIPGEGHTSESEKTGTNCGTKDSKILEVHSKKLEFLFLRGVKLVVQAGQGDAQLGGGFFLPFQRGAVPGQETENDLFFKGPGALGQGEALILLLPGQIIG